MDPITQQLTLAAAGAGGGDPVYVDEVFSTFLYDGNQSSPPTINNGIDLAGKGGLVWIKNRTSNGKRHTLFDTTRGANYYLSSEDRVGSTNTTSLTSFNANGFSLNTTDHIWNGNNEDYVSWTFRKEKGFFDVVTWAGNDTSGRQIPHSLGSVPGMIMIKSTTDNQPWVVYHRSLAATETLELDTFDHKQTGQSEFGNTTPTSSSFTVGGNNGTNGNGRNYIAYIFAHDDASFGTDKDESIIKCGTYTGNGNNQTIDIGFEPQFLLIKNASHNADWVLLDVWRRMDALFSHDDAFLIRANEPDSEGGGARVGVHPRGFGFHNEGNATVNTQNNTYVYMAIRRPHKPPTVGTEVFAMDYSGGSGDGPSYTSGFPVDFAFYKHLNSGGQSWNAAARLWNREEFYFDLNQSAQQSNNMTFDHQKGWRENSGGTDSNYLGWMWRRAPGFFDVVAYNGTSNNNNYVKHNLGVVPEMMWVTKYSDGCQGPVWSSYMPGKYMIIRDSAPANTTQMFQDNLFSATQIGLGSGGDVNASGHQFIAFLFASLEGVSKVGTYTGTGNDINVDCGFTNGARFVLIKRISSPQVGGNDGSNWFIWDTTRGITSGNESRLTLGQSLAQATNDYIDPLNSGFTVASTASNGVNQSGYTYLFYAIA